MGLGIGAMAVSFGGFLTGGALTGTLAGIVGGAVIGAAVGGLTSAVMGGDIGQGVLFGAVGGAVFGGVSGALAPTPVSTAAPAALETAAQAGSASWEAMAVDAGVLSAQEAGAGMGLGALEGAAEGALDFAVSEGGTEIIGNVMAGHAQEEMMQDKLAWEAAEAEKNRQHQKDMAKLSASLSGGGSSSGYWQYKLGMKQLDENIRQFNVQRKDYLMNRAKSKEALGGFQFARAGGKFDEKVPSALDQATAQAPAQEAEAAQAVQVPVVPQVKPVA